MGSLSKRMRKQAERFAPEVRAPVAAPKRGFISVDRKDVQAVGQLSPLGSRGRLALTGVLAASILASKV